MKLLKALKITKYTNGEDMLHLQITEVALVHGNIVNHDNQQDSIVLYIYFPNKSLGQLYDILT